MRRTQSETPKTTILEPALESDNLLSRSPSAGATRDGFYTSLSTRTNSSEEPIDFEMLLTLALESSSKEAAWKAKRTQKILILAMCVLLLTSGMLLSFSYRENGEISGLEKDIQSIEKNSEIEALKRDIKDKKEWIHDISHDPSIDDTERVHMIDAEEKEIDELQKVIIELSQVEQEDQHDEHSGLN
mmetsp:Transcript_26382/g.40332  ORF Transcript_26382/g.40332 Transcript_26382/m.40332 type:complete len:187 (-) Transcript_26382:41-601(-)